MRNADVTHASNVRSWCDRTILGNAEQCAEAQKTSTEEVARCEITQTIPSKLFILKGIVKSELAERKKSKDYLHNRTYSSSSPPLIGREEEMLCDSHRTASLCFQYEEAKSCSFTAIQGW